jgi:hypothetical protein
MVEGNKMKIAFLVVVSLAIAIPIMVNYFIARKVRRENAASINIRDGSTKTK